MRHGLIALSMLLFSVTPAVAQLSINFGSPGVNIGIDLPAYPQLERVPGYPVYYAPGVSSNYFFYDGLYWVYDADNWYESSWYNGPWRMVDPVDVPLYLLRVPVSYYPHPPAYFRSWRASDPPRWGEHWGNSWEKRRSGWDQWNRNSAPAPAPLPTYQRQYSGARYPQPSQQAVIQTQNYRYQPRDAVAQQHFQQQRAQPQQAAPQQPQQAAPRQQPPRPQPQQAERQPQRGPGPREQQAPGPQPQQAERQPQRAQPQQAAPQQQAPRPQPQQAERQPQRGRPQQEAPQQQAPRPQPQQAERQPQRARPQQEAPQPQAPRPQPQQAERQPQRAPAPREQQAPRPAAPERAPQGKEQNNEKGRDNKGQER
jgi:hypothetical protein